MYFLSPIPNVYKHTSLVDCTQNGLYNLKQYDYYKIKNMNDLVHITLLYIINIFAECIFCVLSTRFEETISPPHINLKLVHIHVFGQ